MQQHIGQIQNQFQNHIWQIGAQIRVNIQRDANQIIVIQENKAKKDILKIVLFISGLSFIFGLRYFMM